MAMSSRRGLKTSRARSPILELINCSNLLFRNIDPQADPVPTVLSVISNGSLETTLYEIRSFLLISSSVQKEYLQRFRHPHRR